MKCVLVISVWSLLRISVLLCLSTDGVQYAVQGAIAGMEVRCRATAGPAAPCRLMLQREI